MKQRLGLISLVVREYDEALEFFVGKLGFELVEDTCVPEQASRIGAQTGGRVFLFLHTDDFWRDYERYRAQGIQSTRAPKREPYGTVAVFKDLYGNLWDLLQPA